jgi:HK97 family phage portal protein
MSILDKLFRTKQTIPNSRYFSAGGAIPPDRTTDGFLQAYNSIGWFHAVVFRIALGCSEVKWTLSNVSNREKPKQIYDHRILDLLHNINPFQTSNEFIALDTIYGETTGESFWALNFNALDEPAEIILPYPNKMSVVPAPEFPFVKGYVYGTGAEAVPFDINEIIHFKYPNPMNQYRGLGQAQSISVDLDAEMYKGLWNRQFFFNSARPDGVIQFDYNLSDEQFDKLKRQWSEKYKGVNKAHQVALLEGGGKYVQIQNTVKDMDFNNLSLRNRDIILGVFGMPLSVMGISENVNKANAEAGDYTFARWIVKPRLDWKISKLQEQLIPKFKVSRNLKLGYEEVVPETIEQKRDLAESGMRAGYLTINEARKMQGLDPLPAGDVLLVPLNLIATPIDKIEPPEPPEEEPIDIPVEETPEETPKGKGGEGSGNFGHEGRPGEVGGSGPGGGTSGGDKPKPSDGGGGGTSDGGGTTGEEWHSSLTDDEKRAVRGWTQNRYGDIRNYQLTGEGDRETIALSKSLDTALDKDGSYEGKLYRGIDESESVARDFISLRSERSVLFEINSKSGVDVESLSFRPIEREVILKRGTSYRILSKTEETTTGGNKLLTIKLSE